MGAIALIWLWVWSLPVTSHTLRSALEAQYPAIAVQFLQGAQAIVVLGGSMRPAEIAGQNPDLSSAADRVWHAARLFHAGKAPLMVLIGGSDPQVSTTSEAEAMPVFLTDLGVPANAMLLEARSRHIRQNAEFTADILQPRGMTHILLVTSALHMHRAVALFEAHGFTVTPAATDHDASQRMSVVDWLPDVGALDGSARALKEIVGRALDR